MALPLAATLLACLGGADGAGWENGVQVAPPCDHASVVARVVEIATRFGRCCPDRTAPASG